MIKTKIILMILFLMANANIGFCNESNIPANSNDVKFENTENNINSLKEAITKNPDDLASHQMLSQMYLMNGNYDQAISEANIVITKLPKEFASTQYIIRRQFF